MAASGASPGSSTRDFKVVLLGEARVGKTSILLRYLNNEFNEHQKSTTNAMYNEKQVITDSSRCNLKIWDTAGQEWFHSLTPIYYRGANGAILVYDVTDQKSFERVQTWVKELKKIVGEGIAISIAGNKCDMTKQWVVKKQEASSYAKGIGATHQLTSAKSGQGVEQVFTNLVQGMLLVLHTCPFFLDGNSMSIWFSS
eukprot:gb/GECG01007824.1/.p1 GENE.gb/GECG01007824.1/~~gb/GECG01007824.1/.p1  ORF type:complete len:198 (+),score=19.90 gb/GECG01007824.1/:1-594(+)